MHLKSIKLHNFKSYHEAEFEFSSRLNVIHGRNGVGKTNLLDAVYMLAMTKSNFSLSDHQLIRDDEQFFRLQGHLMKDTDQFKIVIKFPKGKKKSIEKDDIVVARSIDHIGLMPVVMITPDDLNLINASNSERRKLADTTLSQVNHEYLEQLVLYNRLLKQRNSLLKGAQEQGNFDSMLLETYDIRMTAPARFIFEQRRDFFEQMLGRVQSYYEILCEGKEEVNLYYRSELAEASFKDLSIRCISRDRASCRTTAGVHRDTIDFLIKGMDARTYGSQGQKKSLVFAIKLAQLDFMRQKLHDQPIMLLDDVFDKLDQNRVHRLLSIILSDNFGQLFITDTQWDRIGAMLDSHPTEVKKFEIPGDGRDYKLVYDE